MKFLIDHNIPKKLFKTLVDLGHDTVRADRAAPDLDIALKSKSEGRLAKLSLAFISFPCKPVGFNEISSE